MGALSRSTTIASPSLVRRRLLRWASQHGRNFIWRFWRDPFRLLVTEILLKQTRAQSVASFVGGLFDRYPTPPALASAGPELEDELRRLGFATQRGRHLRALARRLAEPPHLDPTNANELRTLPGIGQYSAGMVAAVYGSREAIAVDTNMARVVCRVFRLTPSQAEARKSVNVRSAIGDLTKRAKSPIQVYWAMLDLAASKCTARSPRCSSCPLRPVCAFALDATTSQAITSSFSTSRMQRGK
jgi:A/G-specific adenine glycosylase